LGSVEARHGTIHPTTQLSIHILTHRMATGLTDRLESEESAVLVLNALAQDFRSASPWSTQRLRKSQQRRVEEVRELLASQPTASWCLESIAQAVYCSPFHLARQFRAMTGETIARYLVRLRLALALDHLAQGETDLAWLAVELGFSHHSHFSARFRSIFGMTPSAARNTLTQLRLHQMSKILTAKPRTRC
jgi:AraC-like DNA-binding protein